MRLRFRIADVFADRPLTGNQLAVVLDADALDAETMQAVAREFNFSETTFVSHSEHRECDCRVRIFTPSRELAMAGHPTVGTALVLSREGRIGQRAVFELGVGPTPVEVRGEREAWMTQGQPVFGAAQPERSAVAAALGLEPTDIRTDLPLQVVSTGNPFLLVPLASVEALQRIVPRFDDWGAIASFTDFGAAYCFVEGDPFRARLMAPDLPSEDPATGSAAGPLGAYAKRYLARAAIEVRQGVEIGRPSVISVDAASVQPRVGGRVVVVASGELDLP